MVAQISPKDLISVRLGLGVLCKILFFCNISWLFAYNNLNLTCYVHNFKEKE
jgi:hypothetical protein